MPSERVYISSDEKEIPLVPQPNCDYCSYPIPDEYGLLGHCKYCTQRLKEHHNENFENSPYSFIIATASCLYLSHSPDHGRMGDLLIEFKKNGQNKELIADVMVDTIQENIPIEEIDIIVPIPSGSRISFFPTKQLAEIISSNFEKPMHDLIKFKEGYVPSKGLLKDNKFDNAKDMVLIKEPEAVKDRRILLIDDVMTTCGTVHWTSSELRKNGAELVYVSVAGRSVDNIHLDYIGYTGRI